MRTRDSTHWVGGSFTKEGNCRTHQNQKTYSVCPFFLKRLVMHICAAFAVFCSNQNIIAHRQANNVSNAYSQILKYRRERPFLAHSLFHAKSRRLQISFQHLTSTALFRTATAYHTKLACMNKLYFNCFNLYKARRLGKFFSPQLTSGK